MKALCLLALAGLFLPRLAFAEGLGDEAAVNAVVAKAMGMVANDDIKGAIESFVPYWPLPRAEIEVAIATMVQQRKLIPGRYGKATGIQFVGTKTVAGAVLRVTYLEKFENHPIRWLFIFYRPAGEWKVNGVTFDDKIFALFE